MPFLFMNMQMYALTNQFISFCIVGPGSGIQIFKQPASTASASSASPTIIPTSFTQTEVQSSADKTIAAPGASARVNSLVGNVTSSVSEGKQLQSRKQELPELLESPLLTSTRDGEIPSLDNINSEELNVGADGRSYNEVKIKATKGAEEVKSIEKRTSLELDGGNRIGNVPSSTPGRIDFSQLLRSRRSSSRVASPSTSLSSLSVRSRTGSRLSVSSPEDVTYSSSFPSDTKLSSTKTKVLGGAGVSCSSAAPPPTTPATASPSTVSVTTKTPVTAPFKEAASVLSQSAFRPTTSNAELVAATILPTTPASIFTTPAISPTKRITPAASESSHLESAYASTKSEKPLSLSQSSTLPAATSMPAVLVVSPTTPASSSQLGPLASPAAIFNDLPTPSQTSNISQDEILVSRMVIEKESENDGGEAANLVEKTTEKIELKMASRKFEKEEEEEEEEEEERQPDRRPSLSLSPLSSLSPSISGSPHLLVKASGPSTPRPRSALLFTLLPRSPLASATSKNRTQINEVPESPSPRPTPVVAVVSSNCSPKPIDLDMDIELQSPLFSSPTNSITVERRRKEEDERVSHKLKFPDDNNDSTTNPAIPTTASKVAAPVSTHIPTQGSASIEILLPRDLSPISEVEKGKRTDEGTDKTQLAKVYTSLGDNADIVRVKKRKVLEGSSRTDREPLARNPFGSNSFAKGKGKEGTSMTDREPLTRDPLGLSPFAKRKGKEIDELEVETKSDKAVKKRRLLNLKFRKKGDSLAVTRVRKRKERAGSIVDGEAIVVGQHDELDEERPLKRARQRVSDSQMKTEPAEKGKQISRQFSDSASVSVKKGPPSKARLSVNRGQGKAEVKWPTIAEEHKDVTINLLLFIHSLIHNVSFSFSQLVGCDK